MLRFRLMLAWLLLAALPLQGWAAATMLFCGPAQPGAVIAKVEAAAHGAGHGHQHQQAAHHDANAGDADHGGDAAPAVTDASHTCGVCAACCHGAALAQKQHEPAFAAAPGVHLAEPQVAVLARPSPVPDKPPRA